MKKYLPVFILITLITMFNSCGGLKKNSTKTLNKVTTETEVRSKKETKDSLDFSFYGINETFKKSFNEKITYSTAEPLESIELTAKFKVDTSASLKGDTAIKLFDVNDKNVSVVIYQNNKTNELTAKITSKKGSRDVPFSSLTIDRGYKEESSKVDTTKRIAEITTSKQDTTAKTYSSNKSKETTNKVSTLTWILSGLGLIATGLFLYFKYFKNKTKLTENGK